MPKPHKVVARQVLQDNQWGDGLKIVGSLQKLGDQVDQVTKSFKALNESFVGFSNSNSANGSASETSDLISQNRSLIQSLVDKGILRDPAQSRQWANLLQNGIVASAGVVTAEDIAAYAKGAGKAWQRTSPLDLPLQIIEMQHMHDAAAAGRARRAFDQQIQNGSALGGQHCKAWSKIGMYHHGQIDGHELEALNETKFINNILAHLKRLQKGHQLTKEAVDKWADAAFSGEAARHFKIAAEAIMAKDAQGRSELDRMRTKFEDAKAASSPPKIDDVQTQLPKPSSPASLPSQSPPPKAADSQGVGTLTVVTLAAAAAGLRRILEGPKTGESSLSGGGSAGIDEEVAGGADLGVFGKIAKVTMKRYMSGVVGGAFEAYESWKKGDSPGEIAKNFGKGAITGIATDILAGGLKRLVQSPLGVLAMVDGGLLYGTAKLADMYEKSELAKFDRVKMTEKEYRAWQRAHGKEFPHGIRYAGERAFDGETDVLIGKDTSPEARASLLQWLKDHPSRQPRILPNATRPLDQPPPDQIKSFHPDWQIGRLSKEDRDEAADKVRAKKSLDTANAVAKLYDRTHLYSSRYANWTQAWQGNDENGHEARVGRARMAQPFTMPPPVMTVNPPGKTASLNAKIDAQLRSNHTTVVSLNGHTIWQEMRPYVETLLKDLVTGSASLDGYHNDMATHASAGGHQ